MTGEQDDKAWNRCDICGKFIGMEDFQTEAATRRLVSHDTAFSVEEYETLCRKHTEKRKQRNTT